METLSKKELLVLITDYLKDSPEDSIEFLDAVKEGLNLFKDAVKQQTDHIAYKGIDDLFSMLTGDVPKKRQITYTISAIMHNFPEGKKSIYSEHNKATWKNFIGLCKKRTFDDSWLLVVHALDWFNKYVKPEL